MTLVALKLLIRAVVFGIAITFACRRDEDVKVEPRNMLPLVGLAFAALNMVLYHLLAPALNLVTLWTLWFVVPFAANGIILLVTDRLVKWFRIGSLVALLRTAGIVTVAHLLLHLFRV
jgi:hypothetical protein